MNMKGDCKSSDALYDARLCAQMRTTAAGISESVMAAVPMPSSSSTEVGIPFISDCQPSPSNLVSSRIERLMQSRSEYATATEFEIEASKVHWSELDPTSDEEDESLETKLEIFQSLKEKWGDFFCDYGDGLVLGEKIAEGGQAEIFETSWSSRAVFKLDEDHEGHDVLKVFKEGWALRDLQKQWPEGMLQASTNGDFSGVGVHTSDPIRRACVIDKGVMLKNGRFSFLMKKYWGDLRKLIDFRMQHNHNRSPPFTNEEQVQLLSKLLRGWLHCINTILSIET